MSVSSVGTDFDLCDLEIASIMSSPRGQEIPLASFEDNEVRPVLVEKPDSQGAKEDDPLLVINSLLPMLRLVPDLLRIHGSINETARHTICSYVERVGEFTLTDNVQHGEGVLSPSIFLCLAQLQSPFKPLFPNLRRLRIDNANYSLEYLRLFLSASLETLEIVGQEETCRAPLLSFLSAAVVEVPNLRTLILGPGRLSLDVMNACLGFNRLKHLKLVDAGPAVNHQLLKNIGGLDDLTTFVIDTHTVPYTPSDLIALADVREEQTRARLVEAERRRAVKEEHRRAEDEERRHAERRRKRSSLNKSGYHHCSHCQLLIISGTMCVGCRFIKAHETQEREEAGSEQLEAEWGLQGNIESGLPQQLDASMESQFDGIETFRKLSSLAGRGSAELVQEIFELVSSTSITTLCLELAEPPRDMPPSMPPPTRFLAMINSAQHRWAGTISHLTLLSSLPGLVTEIPEETLGGLARLPELEYLEISGWGTTSLRADDFCHTGDTNPSKLKILHLPIDSDAISILKLESIAKACPDLLSLQCRLENLRDIRNQSAPASNSSSHNLETLIVGDTETTLIRRDLLQVALYIDNLFPHLRQVQPLVSFDQNADQWGFINELVKFRQSARPN